ncbi:MAG TPA: F0F1 ATP synthase subunit A [Thermoanaerobaculia bacterium]|nr:F0F1 ATP synthase subunit A [Thermoanaerobaculia bacterium]
MLALLIENPLEHIVRHPMIQRNGFTLLDSHIVMMMLAAFLLILLVPIGVRRRRGTDEVGALVPAGAGNAIEAICEYLRNEVARPNLHQHTDRFIKFIWTVFFFVFAVNLLGLLPLSGIKLFGAHIGGAATANPWITGALVLVTLGMVVVNGFRLGGKEFVAHFSPGPIWLSWLLIPIEIIGFFSRFFALLIRLCANMIAGHVLLAVLLSFILQAAVKGIGTALGVAVPVVLGSVAITLLELFVALLHAFIFTFLTTLFIGQAVVFHHEGHHEEAEAH